jgi:hypothetical protein
VEHSWAVVCGGYMGVPERCGVKIGAGCGWLLWMGLSGSVHVLVDREGYSAGSTRWWYLYTRCDGVHNSSVCTKAIRVVL